MDEPATGAPKIAAFVCNWCSYAGADAAGTSRLQYDDSVRIIRLPCTGRIDPVFILKAFEQGVEGVLVSGCHPGDCHYVSGNLHARRRFTLFKALMDFLGLDERRLQFSWVSAAEGVKWARVVNAVSEGVKQIDGQAFEWGTPGPRKTHPPPAAPGEPAARPGIEPLAEADAITAQLRARCRQLLEREEVGVAVGYAEGPLPETTTPFFATTAAAADRLVWNRHCVNNLAVYLTSPLVRKFGRVALVAKACDARAVVGLIQEQQIRRQEVVLLGVACDGVVERGTLAAKCRACEAGTPVIYDELLGTAAAAPRPRGDPLAEEVRRLDAMDPQERWNYWQRQFARCIRCYACRAVCPLCYCHTCIADKHRPQWIPRSAGGKGNLAWNVIRAMHLAGRCIGCNECARVCPAGIRLDLLNKKLALEVERRFEYQAGLDAERAPPLTTFRPDDREDFIR